MIPNDLAVVDLAALVDRLRAAGCAFAEEEAQLLVEAAAGPPELHAMGARRVAGEPLEQVLGWAGFCGLRVAVEPGVFVPRRRTELLVREAARLRERAGRRLVVLDLCCGTGAVGAALAALLGDVELHAADLDPAAVRCARRNAPGEVHQGDLYGALPDRLRGRVDLLAANAPYVPTDQIALMPREARQHQARMALDGGADGLELQGRVIADAARWLAPGGVLVIETSQGQARRTAAAVVASGLTGGVVRSDELDGTVVVGSAP